MKRLTLIRHANAEWKDPRMADFERPLNKRGVKESESIARRLVELDLIPDLLVASTAERTRVTAELIAKVLSPKRVQNEERLYLAPADDILSVIRETGPLVMHLMVVGHNPGISDVARLLLPSSKASELGTAAACSIVFKVDEWSGIAPENVLESRYESPPGRGFKLWA